VEGRGGLLERASYGAELDHRRDGPVELVVGPGGDLERVTGLKVPEQALGLPELVSFQGSPRTLAIQGDPWVKPPPGCRT